MKVYPIVPVIGSILLAPACKDGAEAGKNAGSDLPNIVIIYADDLGYGDLSCFGSNIKTPNLDSLAASGMKFTEFYSVAPVCSPSRAGLMTGRIPQRMGIHGVFFPESYTGLPMEEQTMADLLKSQGYTTGMVGKWHLGHLERFLPLQRGFDEYFGIPYSNDMESVVYIEGNEVVDFKVDQRYTTRSYTEKSVDFIQRHKDHPFFLYLAHSMPHVPLYVSEKFEGSSGLGIYGDVICELDWSVGEIVQALRNNDLIDNTLIVFSSDNGPWLLMHELAGSAGILREGKATCFEGGMRVPTIASWPGVIEPGSIYSEMALMTDWFPTVAELSGASLRKDWTYDGESLLQVLKGEGERKGRKFIYFNGGRAEAYRSGDWKLKFEHRKEWNYKWNKWVDAHPLLLVDLKNDPGEKVNLAEAYPEVVNRMKHEMDSMLQSLGDLPKPLVIKSDADKWHSNYLSEKYGVDFYRNFPSK